MKVCVIGLRGFPGVMGGVETHCEQLYPRLKTLRPQDEFVVIGRRPFLERSSFVHEGVEIVPLYSARNKYLEAISNAVAGLLYARFNAGADAVHVHAIGPALIAPLAKLLGLKVVVTHHGSDYNRQKWNGFARLALRAGEYLGVRFSDQLISVSASGARDLHRRFPRHEAQIQHIPNGANHVTQAALPAEASAIDRLALRGTRYAVTVGRMVPEKRFEDVVAAFRKSSALDKLVVVGGAQGENAYFEKLKTLADDRVIFTGSVGHPEVSELLSHAALFVLASSHEGLPIVALEAIAAGAPVLLSDIPANLDIGLPPINYFPLGDVAALAARMQLDPAGLRVGREVCDNYDWGDISKSTSAVYQKLARPRELLLSEFPG